MFITTSFNHLCYIVHTIAFPSLPVLVTTAPSHIPVFSSILYLELPIVTEAGAKKWSQRRNVKKKQQEEQTHIFPWN